MSQPLDGAASRAGERLERIRELEQRLARRPRGVSPLVAALCVFAALFLLWRQREELRYAASSEQPITLGREGDYALGSVVPNRYVQLHGIPTSRAMYGVEAGTPFVVVGLQGSPFLVRRAPLPGEARADGQPPPPPDRRPFAVRGRLLPASRLDRLEPALRAHLAWGEVQPVNGQLYIIDEGVRPLGDVGPLLVAGLLVAFALMNGFFLVRGLELRLLLRRLKVTLRRRRRLWPAAWRRRRSRRAR